MPDIRLIQVDADGVVGYSAKQVVPLCSGELSALQVVLNHLLPRKGTDIFNPSRGGGLADLCRRYRARADRMEEAIAAAVQEAEFSILEDQKSLPLPDSERINSIDLLSVEPVNGRPDSVRINIGVRFATGRSIFLSL
jgi:hypothetical protein